MALGNHLKDLRIKADLSQAALAQRVGIDVTYLSKLENGRQQPSERVLRSLAEALGEEPGRLLVMAGRLPPALQSSLLSSNAPGALSPPHYPTRFIDREEELGRLERLLEAGQLICVTGAPGCGKTRFLAESIPRVVPDRPVTWITVCENDPERIEATLALARRQTGAIVVLDDAERDLDACAKAARQLVAAGATVVATSRQPLRLYASRQLRLTSLPRPDRHLRPTHGEGPTPDLGRLQEQESVQLFVDRAMLARPEFRLDRANAPAVFDVCRWLDGLPLAIELAALRLGQMTVADLAARTGDLLTWLTGNAPDVPDRHASLASAIGWSFDRLEDRLRTVATRLSVFESTFKMSDAVSVAADGEHPREFVEAGVMDLVDCSLLVMRENADRRAVYRWLRPIRQYARLRLEQSADRDLTLERYQAWVRQVVDSLEADPPRREGEWERLAELTPELVSVVYDLPAEEQADAMNRMTDALSKTLQFGNLARHVSWFSERFSERSGEKQQVLREAGMLARVRGDLEEAHSDFMDAYRFAASNRDELAQANAALDLAENAADLDRHAEAREHVERAAVLYEKLDDIRGQIEVLNLRGKLEQEEDHLGAAEKLFNDALDLARQVDDSRLVAYSLHSLGVCDLLMRRVTSARSRLEESMRLRLNMRNMRGVTRVVEAFALVEAAVRNHELVLQLLGAVRQYQRSSGVRHMHEWWKQQLDEVEAQARRSLVASPEAAEHHLSLGASMTVAEAGEVAAHVTSALPRGSLDELLVEGRQPDEPLRRPIASPFEDRGKLAAAYPEQRDLVKVGGSRDGDELLRRVHETNRLLALAEPIESRTADLLCFAVDPHRHRGILVPVFTGGPALAKALERRPDWASRPVLEVRFDQLRASLGRGEALLVDPWTAHELRISSREHVYSSSADATSSIEAPTARSRAISSS